MEDPKSTPLIEILNDYEIWLKNQNIENVKQYMSLGKAFEYLKKNGASEVEYNFLDLLPILIHDGRRDDIKKLVDFIKCTISKYGWTREKENGWDSAKTYLTKFLKYLDTVSSRAFTKLQERLNGELALSYEQQVLLDSAFENRIIYSNGELRKKIKSRLRTQNRTSGDKIWLPLTFIAKLYNPTGTKEGAENGFNEWLDTLVDNVYVHYLDKEKVQKAKFKNEKLHLELVKEEGEKEFHVNVILSKGAKKGECYPALTPTGKGNLKEKMVVKSIDAIAVDHVIAIDTTLKKFEKVLPNLERISTEYKKMQESDDIYRNLNDLANALREEINLDVMIDELYSISNDSPLRLMVSQHNSKKSNGETFQRIIIKSERPKPKQYWGIIEEEEEIYNEEDKRGYYIQELSDSIKKEDNKFRFVTDRLPSKENESKNITGREKLEEILNYI